MKHPFIAWSLLALAGLASVFTVGAAPSWEAAPAQQKQGQFWRWHWYERSLTNANPAYESRFRVNAPEISLHPTFGHRVEPRENGNTKRLDWHGYTKHRLPVATVGTVAQAPFTLNWDTSLLPALKDVAVRAAIRFKADANLAFLTAATGGLEIASREGSQVVLFAPHDLPDHFWSRANQLKTGTLDLDLDPARIERAELNLVTWTGGAGTVKEYFKLNSVYYPVAEGARHELVYSRLPVDSKTLKRGLNRIELLSDTEHHGIEVIYPGPALMVRYHN